MQNIERRTEPNTELFRKIRDQIQDTPGSFSMATWESALLVHPPSRPAFLNVVTNEYEIHRGCDTTRCVAGWGLHFVNPTQGYEATAIDLIEDWDLWEQVEPEDLIIFAGAGILGLSIEDANLLFIHTSDRKAYKVVDLFAEGRNDEAMAVLHGVEL